MLALAVIAAVSYVDAATQHEGTVVVTTLGFEQQQINIVNGHCGV